jgi:hypothetical protein
MRASWLHTLSLSAVLLLPACRGGNDTPIDPEEMLELAPLATKLTSMVDATVRYENPPADASDARLLALATAEDPALLRAFDGYTLKARQEARHGAVLVCTKDGKRALLEDLGCTGALDLRRWESASPAPCEFSLSLSQACKLAQPPQTAPRDPLSVDG